MNNKRIPPQKQVTLILTLVLCVCLINSFVKASEQEHQNGFAYTMEEQNHYNSLLKKFGDFRKTSKNDVKLQIDFTNEKLSLLKNQYKLDEVAGNSSDLSKALNLLFWLCEHTRHKGDYDNHIPMNSLDLLEYSFDKGRENGINCLNLSVVLTECLLSIGLPARIVSLMPFSHEDIDNHVVVHVYIESLGKWIMLDPTSCNYFRDEDGKILDVFELRNMFADDRDVYLNDEFSSQGQKLIDDLEKVQWIKQYMAKNLFYFSIREISTFGQIRTDRGLFVCPENFNILERLINHLEYRIEFIKLYQGIDESVKKSIVESGTKQLEELKNLININDDTIKDMFIYLSPEDFLAAP